MSSRNYVPMFLGLALAALGSASVEAAIIQSGWVDITLTEGVANGIYEFDAYFNDAATRAETLADAAPGNAAFVETPTDPATGTVTLIDPIRPSGEIPSPYPGTPGASRSRQITTLDFDPSDILGSWTPSNDAFAFVGNTTLGEQIALTSMQRWTGPFTGMLLYGDFSLRYVPGRVDSVRSGLVLTSNIDFPNAAFADIGNATIDISGNTLTIQGDLLVSGGLNVLDPSAIPGTDFGNFSLTAQVVPEPASVVLLLLGGLIVIGVAHTRRKQSAAGRKGLS